MNTIRRFASIVGLAAFLCVVATAGATGHGNGQNGRRVGIAGSATSAVGIVGTGGQRRH
jgi:hypothetical protein